MEPAPQLRCFGSPVPLVGDAEIGGTEVLEGDRHAVTSLPYFLYLGFCCVSSESPPEGAGLNGFLFRIRQQCADRVAQPTGLAMLWPARHFIPGSML